MIHEDKQSITLWAMMNKFVWVNAMGRYCLDTTSDVKTDVTPLSTNAPLTLN